MFFDSSTEFVVGVLSYGALGISDGELISLRVKTILRDEIEFATARIDCLFDNLTIEIIVYLCKHPIGIRRADLLTLGVIAVLCDEIESCIRR